MGEISYYSNSLCWAVISLRNHPILRISTNMHIYRPGHYVLKISLFFGVFTKTKHFCMQLQNQIFVVDTKFWNGELIKKFYVVIFAQTYLNILNLTLTFVLKNLNEKTPISVISTKPERSSFVCLQVKTTKSGYHAGQWETNTIL